MSILDTSMALFRAKYKHLLNMTYEDYINESVVEVKMSNGNTMCVFESDKKAKMYIDNSAYSDILNFIWSDAVAKAAGIIDMGANYGQFVLHPLTKDNIDNKSFVLAFEPNPKIARALNLSLDKSGLQNTVRVVENGVGREDGEFDFFINLHSSGGSSINAENAYNPLDGIYRTKITIRTVVVDDYLKSEQINVSDKNIAIKIDVEGYDFYALQGAIQTINDANDFLLIMETTKQRLMIL